MSRDTAPQPEVLPRKTNAIMEVLETLESELLDRIATLEAQLAEAQRTAKSQRIADIMPSASHRIQRSQRLAYIRQLEETNAKLRDELAEAQERLAMAVEALEQHGQHFISCPQDKRRPWNDKRKPCSCGLDAALAPTAEAVAQHTASVERRGAAQFRKQFIAVMEWCVKRVRTAEKDEDYDIACDDVINKLVWFADWTRAANGAAELEGA